MEEAVRILECECTRIVAEGPSIGHILKIHPSHSTCDYCGSDVKTRVFTSEVNVR